jgi:hypothetical protein
MGKRHYTGRAWIYVDGVLYESGDDAKLTGLIGVKRNTVKGASVYGFTEEVMETTVVASFFHSAGLLVKAFADMTDITVVFQCDSGPVFTMAGAWVQEVGDLGVKEGKIQVTFACDPDNVDES